MRLMLLTFSFLCLGLTSVAQEAADSALTSPAAITEAISVPTGETVIAEDSVTAAPVAVTEKSKETLAESEIPLNLENTKKADAGGNGLFRIIMSLSVLVVLGFGGMFFLKKYSVPRVAKHQTQIKVLQQHYLGPKKSLAIIRVAGESILVGITDQNINLIKSLSLMDDEIPDEAPQRFNNVIERFDDEEQEEEKASAKTASRKNEKRSAKELDNEEEFAISGIKDIVSKRLKGMRSFQ